MGFNMRLLQLVMICSLPPTLHVQLSLALSSHFRSADGEERRGETSSPSDKGQLVPPPSGTRPELTELANL